MTNYPEEIYCNDYNIGEIHAAERAYDICKKNAQEAATETEWFNLTEAIEAGEPIDWEQLGAMRVRSEHETGTAVEWNLTKASEYIREVHKNAGWTIFIDRPVPLKRKTADQLEPGTCIRTTDGVLGMVYEDADGIKGFWGANQTVKLADEVEVQTEYGIGTFKVVDNEA